MLRDFLIWWGEQLAGLLPARLTQRTALTGDALILAADGAPSGVSMIEASLRRRGRISRLGRFVLDEAGREALRRAVGRVGPAAHVILQLPPGQLLEKRLILPLAAERDLDSVLSYGIDRETPFTAEEVFWAATAIERDSAQSQLAVRLSLLPRAPLEHLMAALRAIGMAPATLAAAPRGAGSGDAGLRFIAVDRGAAGPTGWRRRAVPLTGALCVVLAGIAIALPFLRQSAALSEIEAQIAGLQPEVDEAGRLNRQIAGAGGDLMAAEQARVGDALKALAATTDALPDDTYLTDLSLKARKLSLNGRSASAARLLASLAGRPDFKAPAFAAPVTKPDGTSAEIFTIDAETLQ